MFYPLKVSKINKETPSAISVVFDVPSELVTTFNFSPGQFLGLKHNINGKEVRRSYSLCSIPRSKELKIAIKKVEGGLFSTYAVDQMKEGEIIEVAAPAGKFIINCLSNHTRKYVFIAAGSGITPILSMIKTVLNEEPLSSVFLIYGNKSKEDTIFYNELQSLLGIYNKRLQVNFIFSQENTGNLLESGRIDSDKMNQLQNQWGGFKEAYGYYFCGPQAMIENISSFLKHQGVEEKQIHFELFNVASAAPMEVNADFDKAKVTATIRGVDYVFEVKKGQSVLDAALSAKIDMPYSCHGGVCGSCECRVNKGEVELLQNMVLSDSEVEDGQALACQAIAKTEVIEISFDF